MNIQMLKDFLTVNFDTGEIFWKDPPPKSYFDNDRKYNIFYGMTKGKKAFNTINCEGYLRGSLLGKDYKAHRIIYALYYEKVPNIINHINRDRTDNRIENLESVDSVQNSKNKSLAKNNTTGHNGVSKRGNSYRAYITINNVYINLGSFDNMKDAIKAREEANIKYCFYKNHGL